MKKTILAFSAMMLILSSALQAFPFDKTNYQNFQLCDNDFEIISLPIRLEKSFYDGVETWMAKDTNVNGWAIIQFKTNSSKTPEFGYFSNSDNKWYFESNVFYEISEGGHHKYIFYFKESDSYFKFLLNSEKRIGLGGWAIEK